MAFPTPKRITELDLASPLTDADQIAVVQGTRTKRATISQVKTSTDTSCQCTLVSRYNTVGTDANTLEKFFQTYQLPADTFSTDGSWLEIIAWGAFSANTNTKTIKLTLGSTSIATPASSWGGAFAQRWILNGLIIRTSQNTQDFSYQITSAYSGITGAASGFGNNTTSSENLGNDIVISISGINGTANANDITCEGFIIRVNYMDANS